MGYIEQFYVTGPKEAVKRMLDEVIPRSIGPREVICEDETNYTVQLCMDEEVWSELDEEFPSSSDLVRIYGVTIFEDVYEPEYEGGAYCETIIVEPGDGAPITTEIKPWQSIRDYEDAFVKLIEYDPERYRKVKIEALEALTRNIQREIARERIEIVKDKATANDGQVYIPKEVTETGPYDFNGFPIESIEVHPDNPKYCAEGNCLLTKDRTVVILGCKNSVIPEGVSEIGIRAFAGCKDLVHIDIPESVKIMHDAFAGCPCEADFKKRYYEEDLPF